MDLQLASVVACTGSGCEARTLDGIRVDAEYSEPMIENRIGARPGDLVALDCAADPPQVVYRWLVFTVERVEGGRIFIDSPGYRYRPATRAEGVDESIAAGDKVCAVHGVIHDICVDGRPTHPERLRTIFFPQIHAMYAQIEKWKALDPKQVVEEGYDQMAERHHEWAQNARAEERARYASLVLDKLPRGAEMLDLGCGAGVPTTRELARKFTVTGVDISERQVELARRNVPDARFIHADATQLDFAPARFDGVVSFYAFIHIPRQEHASLLRKVAGWLRPGGLFVAAMGTRAVNRDFAEDFLGARMFWSGFDSATNKRLVEEAGLSTESAKEETAVEFDRPITFLWVVARR